MDLIDIDSLNGGSPEIYDDLVNRIDAIRSEFKILRNFYEDNKKSKQQQEIFEQWYLNSLNIKKRKFRIQEFDKKILNMKQYFEEPQVLHQQMNFKFPYEIIEKFFDEKKSLMQYFDEEFQKVQTGMDKNEYRSKNFDLLSQMMKETIK